MTAVKPSIERKVNVPQNAYEALGIDLKEYYKISRNISRMNLLIMEQRKRILEEANEKLPGEIILRANILARDLAEDRNVYEIAGLPYHRGPPEGQNLFITAVVDYLLRERPFEPRTNN